MQHHNRIINLKRIEELQLIANRLSALVPLGSNNLGQSLTWEELDEAYKAYLKIIEIEDSLKVC